jgi:AcrR family transcriptional regulator
LADTDPKAPAKARSKRLAPDARQQQILEGAIAYFAEFGFEGGTRALASFLGISQALLFRYFPNKAALVDRVYEVVFLNRWNPQWKALLTNRELPLADRLKAFYKDYNRSIDRYEVIRISLFSALRNESISQRYVARLREQLIAPMVEECRAHLGLPATGGLPLGSLEEQLVLSLHATVIYGIMRKHVFHAAAPGDSDFLIELYVDSFVSHAAESFRRVLQRAEQSASIAA